MLYIEKITTKEVRFQRYIGLKLKQLNLLTQRVNPLWSKAESKRLNNNKSRERKVGGGNSYKLKLMRDKIVTVLIYYKQNITQELLGDLVGLDQCNISRLLKKMLPLIEEAADPELKNYLAQAKKDCKKITTLDELYRKHPDLRDVSTDATEQRCYRPIKYEEQKQYYSGKSKQHSTKVQISIAAEGRILDVSKSYTGRVHDKKIIDKEKTVTKFDKRVPHRFDSGYQGLKGENPKYYIIAPTKKPKGRELTPLEKEQNRANSKLRIVVEHAFSKIKKFKICANTFRQSLEMHNQTFRNVVAILNFKLKNPALAV